MPKISVGNITDTSLAVDVRGFAVKRALIATSDNGQIDVATITVRVEVIVRAPHVETVVAARVVDEEDKQRNGGHKKVSMCSQAFLTMSNHDSGLDRNECLLGVEWTLLERYTGQVGNGLLVRDAIPLVVADSGAGLAGATLPHVVNSFLGEFLPGLVPVCDVTNQADRLVDGLRNQSACGRTEDSNRVRVLTCHKLLHLLAFNGVRWSRCRKGTSSTEKSNEGDTESHLGRCLG